MTFNHHNIRKSNRDLIAKAAQDPELDHMGHVNLARTFKKYGILKNQAFAHYFYDILDKKYITNKDTKGQAIASMPFGPKAIELGWKALKEPCLYAIVCKYTGRAYIGTSESPWLRRAVHYYWLKNYFRYGSSNIFFGNLKLAADVKEYGADSFYLEVIEHMPNANAADLLKAETDFMVLHGLDKCYNKWHQGLPLKYRNSFMEIEPEYKALFDKGTAAYQDYDRYLMEHHEFIQEKNEQRKELKEMLKNGKITKDEFFKKTRSLSEEHNDRKAFHQKLYKEYKTLKAQAKKMLSELKIKYAKTKVPLY
jgi:hypothetical protein